MGEKVDLHKVIHKKLKKTTKQASGVDVKKKRKKMTETPIATLMTLKTPQEKEMKQYLDLKNKLTEQKAEKFFKDIEKYKNKKLAKEVAMLAAHSVAALIFIQAKITKDFVYAKKLFLEAVKYNPESAFRKFHHYSGMPWAKEILLQADLQSPENLLVEYYCVYRKKSWAKSLIYARTTEKFRKALKRIDEISKNPQIKKAILKEIKNNEFNSAYLFIICSKFKNKSWAKELMINVNKKASKFAYYELDRFKDKEWAGEVLANMPWVTVNAVLHDLMSYKKYKNAVWLKDFFSRLAESKNADAVFSFYRVIKNKSWEKEIMLKALKKETVKAVLRYCNYYSDTIWAKDLLLKCASLDPQKTAIAVHEFKDKPWAVEVMAIVANLSPGHTFKALVVCKKEPWVGEIALIASKHNPIEGLLFIEEHFLNESWGEKAFLNCIKSKKLNMIHIYRLEPTTWQRLHIPIMKSIASNLIGETLDHLISKYHGKEWLQMAVFTGIKRAGTSFLLDDKVINEVLTYFQSKDDLFASKIKGMIESKREKLYEIAETMIKQKIKATIKLKNYISFPRKALSALVPIVRIHDIITKKYINDNTNKDIENSLVENFLEDKALESVLDINPEWIDPKPKSQKAVIEFRVIVARNLYKAGINVTKSNVQKEYKEILEERKTYSKKPVFKDTNIVYAVHNQTLNIRTPSYLPVTSPLRMNLSFTIFGREDTIEALENQKPKSLEVLRAKNTLKSLREKKVAILNCIENTPPPLSFIFEGHASTSEMILTKGEKVRASETEIDKVKSITVDEFAKALKVRYLKYGKDPKEADSKFILGGCYNHTFLRKVYKKLKKSLPEMKFPIQIGLSEYGQESIGGVDSKYVQHIEGLTGINLQKYNFISFRTLLVELQDKTLTYGTIIKYAQAVVNNPSIYVPRKDGKGFRQII